MYNQPTQYQIPCSIHTREKLAFARIQLLQSPIMKSTPYQFNNIHPPAVHIHTLTHTTRSNMWYRWWHPELPQGTLPQWLRDATRCRASVLDSAKRVGGARGTPQSPLVVLGLASPQATALAPRHRCTLAPKAEGGWVATAISCAARPVGPSSARPDGAGVEGLAGAH
jgi:hypothetical protein